MKTSQRNLSRFSRYLWLTLGMLLVFASTFGLYVWSERQVDRANALRAQSDLLASRLVQQSKRLTFAAFICSVLAIVGLSMTGPA